MIIQKDSAKCEERNRRWWLGCVPRMIFSGCGEIDGRNGPAGEIGYGDRGIGQLRPVWLSTASGVAKPGCIVSRWEIGSMMGSRLSSRPKASRRWSRQFRCIEVPAPESGSVRKILVLHAHGFVRVPERLDGVLRLLHGLFGAEDAEVEAHGFSEVIPICQARSGPGLVSRVFTLGFVVDV